MNNHRILIVDDEAAIRSSYRSILETTPVEEELDALALDLFGDFMADVSPDTTDETDEFSSIEGMADRKPYLVMEASQGLEAVELVRDAVFRGEPYSLMFLDMRMPPGIDGAETARRVRELDPMIEIVIMTAYSDYTMKQIIDHVGNPDRLLYFHKPFSSEQITQLASSLTQRWALENDSHHQS